MSDNPRWQYPQDDAQPLGLKITTRPEAADSDVGDIMGRLEKAGWITDLHLETADGFTGEWTPLGLERIAQMAAIARPLMDRIGDDTKPKVGIIKQFVIAFRLRRQFRELQPPVFSDVEIYKVLVFVKMFGPA